jgi:Glycosyltransferase family 25 (LPS biosynthesis protein)
MSFQYYLIHGIDKARGPRMLSEFERWGLDNDKVKWILSPNKNEIDGLMRNNLLIQSESISCGMLYPPGCPNIGNGKVSCTYKHFLCLKDIVENNYNYGIIMEDNQFFSGNIHENVVKYVNQLNELYPEWDIIFDTKWKKFQEINEVDVKDGVYVYPKSNEITNYCHGGTRLAQFYIVTNKCAKRLYENYIPFNNAPDWWMNDLFRKLNIKSFWSEPSISDNYPHVSTAN